MNFLSGEIKQIKIDSIFNCKNIVKATNICFESAWTLYFYIYK